MAEITDVVIISVDKSYEPWAIEGEIFFESDLTSPFSANYFEEDDELEKLEIEIDPGGFDKVLLKNKIVEAANNFED